MLSDTDSVRGTAPAGPESCDTVDHGYDCSPSISRSWGQYSPYFSVPSEIPTDLPSTCSVTFAQVLARHGARDPTAKMSPRYAETINHIHKNVKRFKGKFSFLKDYKYKLGADQLTVFGEQEMVNLGINFYQRYRSLAKETIPFLRAAGQKRVVDSAVNFTQGYHLARGRDLRGRVDSKFPYPVVILEEGPDFNNTLNHGLCTSFEEGEYSTIGEKAQEKWADIFTPPITAHLNGKLKGAKLNKEQTLHLMDLCPFETVAHPSGKPSPFCKLFSVEDWEAYGYYQSLGKWYGFSDGNPLGATQGVGFVNELIARLTNSQVRDHTSTNSTLDDNDATFPVGDTLYADFSHDNDLSGHFAALGLYSDTEPLSKRHIQTPQQTKGYSASWTVPFSSRMYVEKMVCDGTDGELVRILVNDRVVPLTTCGGDEFGRCKLAAFVESLKFAQDGGRWEKCFV